MEPGNRCPVTVTSGATQPFLLELQLIGEQGKSGVGPDRIESRVDFDRDEFETTIPEGISEPFESLVRLLEREVNRSDLERRHISFLRQAVELFEFAQRLVFPSAQR